MHSTHLRLIAGVLSLSVLALGSSLFHASAASNAAPEANPRLNITQRGDVVVIGNTLGQDCATGVPAPVVGTVGACGTNTGDSAIDVFWRADAPAVGQAQANTSLTNAQARSTARLGIPNAANVTQAYLYWAARWNGAGKTGDPNATIEFNQGNSLQVTALNTDIIGTNSYQSVADVTTYIQQHGSGAYRVSGVASTELANLNDPSMFAAWWLVVIYADATQPNRTIIIHDTLSLVIDGAPFTTDLSGFNVPSSSTSNLTIVGYEGDNTSTGDQIQFNNNLLSNAQNPGNNIMNSSRSYLGNSVSTAGDLPQLAGNPGSMGGLDLDTYDVSDLTSPGQTEATISASSTGDVYYVGGVILAITSLVADAPTPTETNTPIPTATATSTETPTNTPTATETPVATWRVFLPAVIRTTN
ncbi:hypothetical protein ACP8Y2_07955 [Herpetosiphon llansteffanensis]